MTKILCAIRGGEASQRIQDIAINLAKERNEDIVFLYVVNIEFLDTASQALRESVTREMEKLGDFLLLMAQERAKKSDIICEHIAPAWLLTRRIRSRCQRAGYFNRAPGHTWRRWLFLNGVFGSSRQRNRGKLSGRSIDLLKFE